MENFTKIIEKYGLASRADEVADFLVGSSEKKFTAEEFAEKFSVELKDAEYMLDFIYRSMELKKNFILK